MRRLSLLLLLVAPLAAEPSADGFASPPDWARPWVYWFWLNGNITPEGITADLEAMAREGIGGVLIMEVDQGAPVGPVDFAGPRWRELFGHVCREADRLGLPVNMNNDAGWCGSGGPWITPEQSMQRVTSTETSTAGPGRRELNLPQPGASHGYYRDIAVLAVPTLANQARVPGIGTKAVYGVQPVSHQPRAEWPEPPAESCLPRGRIVDLTDRMQPDGRLTWEVPAGDWTVIRFGHTSTGSMNLPSPATGRGLECDKLSAEAAQAHFAGLIGRLADDVGDLAGRSFVATHIDSWEVGVQNWTARFPEEFARRRGYDIVPFLPVLTGRVVDSMEVSERFLWDFRQTISELILDNYAGEIGRLAREQGMRLTMEGYHTCPVDEFAYAGRSDEPMGEFWSWGKFGAAFSMTEMASAGHVYGRRVIGAEAFTAHQGEAWLGHPGNQKDLGDWAFAEGINRFVFHRYAMQPWLNRAPGMSMGPWGLHYERTQTWWDQVDAYHQYLARCQYLLQQGLFVADSLLLAPEGSPQTLNGQQILNQGAAPGEPFDRPGHNLDFCSSEVVLQRLRVADGRLTLPDGMNYTLLALPRAETMTPELLRRIRDLVRAGASVMGLPPRKSPSLAGHPGCDAELAALVRELWGDGEPPAELTVRRVGRGRVVWGRELQGPPAAGEQPSLTGATWIWTTEPQPAPPGTRSFRTSFEVGAEPVDSARLTLTADNTFEAWIGGQRVAAGDEWNRLWTADVRGRLKPGGNVLAIAVTNTTDAPTPAGVAARLTIVYRGGRRQVVQTGADWTAAATPPDDWRAAAAPAGFGPVSVLGPYGIDPWGDAEQAAGAIALYPELGTIERVHELLGTPPDFGYQSTSGARSARWIHRRIDGADVYFVANKLAREESLLATFRVQGRRPELWYPETGRVVRPAIYDAVDGGTRLPLVLGPQESVFVVFGADAYEADRVVGASAGGRDLLALPEAAVATGDRREQVTANFVQAVWANPTADTPLPAESGAGAGGMVGEVNLALYPPPGHEVYSADGQAGSGLAVGRNGVVVLEHAADYFAPVLVWAGAVDGWTHLAVAYRDGVPHLFVNGALVRRGVRGPLAVHPGAGVPHGRGAARFAGDLGPWTVLERAASDAEVAALARSMPRPRIAPAVPLPRLERAADGSIVAVSPTAAGVEFRAANGRVGRLPAVPAPAALPVGGPWRVRFAPGGGAPEAVTLPELISWSRHEDPGVRYFSGVAEYRTTFTAPAEPAAMRLDLGRVEVMATVILNGRELATLWRAPYTVDLGTALEPGGNELVIRVANLWVNRQIGDESLPEDSRRHPNGTLVEWPAWLNSDQPSPTGRYTFTSWRLWGKDSPLVDSGLLGPVTLQPLTATPVSWGAPPRAQRPVRR